MEKVRDLFKVIKKATAIMEKEPVFVDLPQRPTVFVGDTHGDVETTEKILERFGREYVKVFLGDYIDRAPKPGGSPRNVIRLLREKTQFPDDIVLLRGNHDFNRRNTELYEEAKAIFRYSKTISKGIMAAFRQFPYVASTENGIIAMHGGIPNVSSLEELKALPKGLDHYRENQTISQIVWSDNSNGQFGIKGFTNNYKRNFPDYSVLLYGETYFEEKMKLFDKTVLLRGHDPDAKGFAFKDRVLTVHSSKEYARRGRMKGTYVAVMENPAKEIRTAKDLRLEFFDEHNNS